MFTYFPVHLYSTEDVDLGYIMVGMQGISSHGVFSQATERFAHPVRNVAALQVEPGMKVADFGAGSGVYTFAIAEALSGSGVVYAVDVQKDLLRRIKNDAQRRGFKNIEILWGDLEEKHGSKIADGALDLVLVSNVLFQLEDKKAAITEAHRVLKPHGRLAIIDWRESYGGLGPVKNDVVDQQAGLELAKKCHFELIREFPAGAHHYGLLLKKTKQGS